jgi:hypothetical protein
VARIGLLSFRLGGTDGISVASMAWQRLLQTLGHEVLRIAGEGVVDRLVPWLSPAHAKLTPSVAELADVIDDLDLVIVENLLTLPLHLPASRAVAQVLRGRPAVLRHFDPPWHRAQFAHITELPVHDPSNRGAKEDAAQPTVLADGIEVFDVRSENFDRLTNDAGSESATSTSTALTTRLTLRLVEYGAGAGGWSANACDRVWEVMR